MFDVCPAEEFYAPRNGTKQRDGGALCVGQLCTNGVSGHERTALVAQTNGEVKIKKLRSRCIDRFATNGQGISFVLPKTKIFQQTRGNDTVQQPGRQQDLPQRLIQRLLPTVATIATVGTIAWATGRLTHDLQGGRRFAVFFQIACRGGNWREISGQRSKDWRQGIALT